MSQAFTIDGLDRLKKMVYDAIIGLSDWRIQMLRASVFTADSIQRNFLAQGRPAPWLPSKRAIRENGLTLRDTDTLFNSIRGQRIIRSITTNAGGTEMIMGPDLSLGYGPNLHFGEVGVYPPRPWFMLQDGDEAPLVALLLMDFPRKMGGLI